MRSIYGLALAGALMIGAASEATAQVAISVGNPYLGQGLIGGVNPYGYSGFGVGSPLGYGAVAPGYGGYSPLGYSSVYSSSYYGGFAPVTRVYSSGYAGYAPVYGPVAPVYGYGYRRPYGRGVLRRW